METSTKRLLAIQVIVLFMALLATAFLVLRIPPLVKRANDAKTAAIDAQNQVAAATRQLEDLEAESEKLQLKVAETNALFNEVAAPILGQLLNSKNVNIVDPDISFDDITADFLKLPPGRCKSAVLTALLMSWKDVPFRKNGTNPTEGLGSAEFLMFVLEKVGIKVQLKPGMRPSESLISALTKVASPQVCDIAMYEGSEGNYGGLIVSLGAHSNGPIVVGTYNAGLRLQVRSINKGSKPLLGYFRPPYDDLDLPAAPPAP